MINVLTVHTITLQNKMIILKILSRNINKLIAKICCSIINNKLMKIVTKNLKILMSTQQTVNNKLAIKKIKLMKIRSQLNLHVLKVFFYFVIYQKNVYLIILLNTLFKNNKNLNS